MDIGQVIRKYRKIKNLTQEEMANRLGVSAPAVNKWENGNSLPDITLLAPIARLLAITPDTLLSFREELTQEEIHDIVGQVDRMVKEESYEEAFRWAKRKAEEYPGCERLMVQMAMILNAHGILKGIHEQPYEEVIFQWNQRALKSRDEGIRTWAAEGLYGFYQRKGQYEKAEECLGFFSEQNPEKKRKQAEIYEATGRRDQAYKAYEELLFSSYQSASAYFYSICMLALKDGNMEKAHMIAAKQGDLAELFDMGEYYQVLGSLDLAVMEKDVENTIRIMEKMIFNVDHICGWTESDLYEHMMFRKAKPEFFEGLKRNLWNCFRDEERFGFMKGDVRWERLKDAMAEKFSMVTKA